MIEQRVGIRDRVPLGIFSVFRGRDVRATGFREKTLGRSMTDGFYRKSSCGVSSNSRLFIVFTHTT